jgi:cytochrome c peroxidase
VKVKRHIALCFSLLVGVPSVAKETSIVLSADCPPGFELSTGQCELRSLYQMYPSLQGAGVGGLKTGLPRWRDGFTPQQTDLGRYLFFDPVLSRDGTVSCATCHAPDKGFSDGLGRSVGINGSVLPRSAPTLWNVAFLNSFFWDGRADSLEDQMVGPLYDQHEMGSDPQSLLATLNGIPAYRQLFAQAFPAAFPDPEAEKEGLNIFRSFVARCAECHTPPLFTNQQIAVLGTPEPDGMPFDAGAQIPMNEPSQRGGFKVPTLRNIELTAPYMHSGRFATLREAVAFYTGGRGHAVPEGEELKIHWHVWEPDLTDDELDRLVDFLKTLTDERFKPRQPQHLPSGLRPMHNQIADSGEIDNGVKDHE